MTEHQIDHIVPVINIESIVFQKKKH